MFKSNIDPDLLEAMADPRWRLNNCYEITDKSGERVRFEENEIQRHLNDFDFNTLFDSQGNEIVKRRKKILKGRQFGVSTNELIKMADYTFFNKNRVSCILAHEDDAIAKLFRIPRNAWKSLDPCFRPELDRGGGSKYEMYFPDINSRIYCDLESRGDTIHWLHISEAAFIADEGRIKATLECVPMDTGIVTFETTPNGLGNHFFDRWNDQNDGYKAFFFPWFFFKQYRLPVESDIELTKDEKDFIKKVKQGYGVSITKEQIVWRRAKMADLKGLFIQEYPEDDQTCFLTTGNVVFDSVLLKRLEKDLPSPLLDDGSLKIYEEYDQDELYVIGADPAEGVGGDFSVAQVIKVKTMTQVATLRGQFKPMDFAYQLNELGRLYTMGGRMWPLMGVERNNHGHAVLLQLENLNYPNIYNGSDERPGWKTDSITRPRMIDTFVDGVENGTCRITDRDTLKECQTLIEENKKIQAAKTKHDDCVMSMAIGLQLALEASKIYHYNDIKGQFRL